MHTEKIEASCIEQLMEKDAEVGDDVGPNVRPCTQPGKALTSPAQR